MRVDTRIDFVWFKIKCITKYYCITYIIQCTETS